MAQIQKSICDRVLKRSPGLATSICQFMEKERVPSEKSGCLHVKVRFGKAAVIPIAQIELTTENPVLSEPLGYYTSPGTLDGIRGRLTASNSEDRLC